ncbi:tetratricopeptide repeat-containing sulfotransferase family protein [Microbulbifer marinus]|uniref:Tetratricopeptide repeat-containing protein n=1 Tax=Microbulbifer marinus TaxID=658218 RepID=A0A1H4AFK4_9GAMM|nr:sulfotransferase [Microbulbifer marinus]SEA34863.1 Tetratricopeptide repeat-containing protein [Microbulbifer marinus]
MTTHKALENYKGRLKKKLELALSHNDIQACTHIGKLLVEIPELDAKAWLLLSEVYRRTKRTEDALDAIDKGLKLQPNHPHHVAQQAFCLLSNGNFSDLIPALRHAKELNIQDTWSLDILGTSSASIDEHTLAIHFFTKATKIAPSVLRFRHNLAMSQIALGRTIEAEKNFRNIIKESPSSGKAYWGLSLIDRCKSSDLKDLIKIANSESSTEEEKVFARFSLGSLLEKNKNFEESFKYYKLGNDSKRRQIKFSIHEEKNKFSKIKQTFNKDWISNKESGNQTDQVIFICGLPRTGTTLIERMLSSHSSVTPYGELRNFGIALKKLCERPLNLDYDLDTIHASAKLPMQQLGETYLSSIPKDDNHTTHIIDKNPFNFLYIPLIAKSLPNAKIIHMTRDPMDTCFSNYKQLFSAVAFYSYDLEELAEYYLLYRNLTEYWEQQLPSQVTRISYENLIENPKRELEKLLGFCELQWEDECLNHPNTKSQVATASAMQARKPIYHSSVGKWKAYQKFLSSALDILIQAEIKLN